MIASLTDSSPSVPHRRLAVVALVAACGGGGSGDPAPVASTPPAPAASPAPAPTTAPPDQRILAAKTTAESLTNACAALGLFYWEIGDRDSARASGSVGSDAAGQPVYTAATRMALASASKWLYAAYVVERQDGALPAADLPFLHFTSGYTRFDNCFAFQTVDSCLARGDNGTRVPADVGKFAYGGGHLQKHASLTGLGALDAAGLAAELRGRLGEDSELGFNQPQTAGGGEGTAQGYARVLRKMLRGELKIGALLGTQAVCTNPATCAAAINTPVPASESWHYALGHWVEDDPAVGDGAFSSAGSFGFYPWIDAGKTSYGVLARRVQAGNGIESASCGRLIRKAWATGSPQV